MYVAFGMVGAIGDSDGLYDLRKKLLCPRVAEAAPGWHENSRRKRQRNCIDGMRAINRSGVSRGGRVDRVVQGIQAERDVVRYPINSVTAANNDFRIDAVGETDARGIFVFFERQVVALARG